MQFNTTTSGARIVLHIALFLFVIMTSASSCESSVAPEPTTYDGTWSGVFKFMYDRGTITLCVDKNKACSIEATVAGSLDQWEGTYRMDFEGDLVIQLDGSIAGEVSLIRYCPGRDTLATTAIMSGKFELAAKGIYQGEWNTIPGAPFMAGGTWGASKEPN